LLGCINLLAETAVPRCATGTAAVFGKGRLGALEGEVVEIRRARCVAPVQDALGMAFWTRIITEAGLINRSLKARVYRDINLKTEMNFDAAIFAFELDVTRELCAIVCSF
jgi:hypothetical protein